MTTPALVSFTIISVIIILHTLAIIDYPLFRKWLPLHPVLFAIVCSIANSVVVLFFRLSISDYCLPSQQSTMIFLYNLSTICHLNPLHGNWLSLHRSTIYQYNYPISFVFGKLPPLHCLPSQLSSFVCGKAIFSFFRQLVVVHHPQNQFQCLSLVHDQIMILIELTRSRNVDDSLTTMIITTLPSYSPCLGTLRARCLIFLGCSSDNSNVDASLQQKL